MSRRNRDRRVGGPHGDRTSAWLGVTVALLVMLMPLGCRGTSLRPNTGSGPDESPLELATQDPDLDHSDDPTHEDSPPAAVPIETPPDGADDPAVPPPPLKNRVSFSFGPTWWGDLADVDPSSSGFDPSDFGAFEEWGIAMAASYHRRVRETSIGTLWLGGNLGFSTFANERDFDVLVLPSGNTIDGSFNASLFHIAPSAQLTGSLSSRVQVFAGGGAGYYHLSLVESFDGYSDDIDSDGGFGGFVNFGLDITISSEIALRLEDQVHFVDLKAFPDILSAGESIEGPINQILIGVTFEF